MITSNTSMSGIRLISSSSLPRPRRKSMASPLPAGTAAGTGGSPRPGRAACADGRTRSVAGGAAALTVQDFDQFHRLHFHIHHQAIDQRTEMAVRNQRRDRQ